MSNDLRSLPPDDSLLDAEETGEVLRVSKSTVLRWAAAGAIAFSRVGGRTLFLGADIRAFVASKRQERCTLGQKVGAVLRR